MVIENNNYHRDSDYVKYDSMFKNIFLKRVNLITKFVKKGRLLEIGSSTGIMLNLFKDLGWDVLGIEPSKSCREAWRKKLKVLNLQFEDAEIPKNYFDLVIMNHTLEHMEKPFEVLTKIKSLLKVNGILYVDVPNYGSLSSNILGNKWPYLLPNEHKHQFTKKSLADLIQKAGFKVIYWQSRSGIFEYSNPLKELGRKRFLIELFAFPYSLIATLLRMGDSMSFVAKKIS